MSAQIFCAALPDRALVAVNGPDWRKFLQGLLTQDVDTLEVGELRFGAMLTPQGRLLHDMFLMGQPQGCLMDVQAGQRDDLVRRLTMYRLRAKVEIAPAEGQVLAAWGEAEGPTGADWAPDPRLAALGWRGLGGSAPVGALSAYAGDYDAHRLSLGVPDPGRDCVSDKLYPIEADFDLLHGIDFKKGCFVGQETTSRMKRRGQIKTRMLPITFDGETLAFGSEILSGDDLRTGEVLSSRAGRAMALLRLDRMEGALQVCGRAIRPAPPPWLGL